MNKRLTVVQVLPALESGGVERGTLEVAGELVRRGHRALVISAGGRMVDELRALGAEHIAWPIGKKSLLTLRLVPRLRELLMERQADILHARSRLPAWIAYLAWRSMNPATRPRFVTTVHGLYSVNRYSAVMMRGECIIAVSETIRRYILQNYPRVESDKICLIYRGVDAREFPYGHRPSESWWRAWYEQYPQLRDKFVITLPGRLTRLKGHADFIELMTRLKDYDIAAHGLIVGGVDEHRRAYAEEIIRLARQRDLNTITFTGQRADMREIYAASNLVLSLSQQPESFGRTVLEALSLGVPVIGYAHGGVGEILEAVYQQGLIPPGDVAALEQRVLEFMRQPPPVPETHPFSLQAMLDATMALYQDAALSAR
ncbi:MAG: glycosyltransferase [Gammaproteobacteria bacterium]|nr:MAG: glycosyltransferase [Gammaproteobacteria bacterium]